MKNQFTSQSSYWYGSGFINWALYETGEWSDIEFELFKDNHDTSLSCLQLVVKRNWSITNKNNDRNQRSNGNFENNDRRISAGHFHELIIG